MRKNSENYKQLFTFYNSIMRQNNLGISNIIN